MSEDTATRPMPTGPSIGTVVQAWRTYRGMTGTELAQKASLDKSYVWQLEHSYIRQPKGVILERIAEALRVPLETLTLRKPPPTEVPAPEISSGVQTAPRPPVGRPAAPLDLGARPLDLAHVNEETSPLDIEVGVRAWLVRVYAEETERSAYPIRGRVTVLGRDVERVDIPLLKSHVSRVHARLIEEQRGRFVLYDGEDTRPSRNGTYVNDVRVLPDAPAELKNGDVIQIGDFVLVFQPVVSGAESEASGA